MFDLNFFDDMRPSIGCGTNWSERNERIIHFRPKPRAIFFIARFSPTALPFQI
jgi:hypothetical protein